MQTHIVQGSTVFKGQLIRIKLHPHSSSGWFTQVVNSVKKKIIQINHVTKWANQPSKTVALAFLYQPIICYVRSSWLTSYFFSYRFSIAFISGHNYIFFSVCQSHFGPKPFYFSVGAHSLPLITFPHLLNPFSDLLSTGIISLVTKPSNYASLIFYFWSPGIFLVGTLSALFLIRLSFLLIFGVINKLHNQ